MNFNEFDTLPEELVNEASELPREEKEEKTSTDGADEVTLTVEQMKQLEELAKQAVTMEKELKESSDKYLRLLAEYDNYRKRTQKEKEAIAGDVKAAVILTLLPYMIICCGRCLRRRKTQRFIKA